MYFLGGEIKRTHHNQNHFHIRYYHYDYVLIFFYLHHHLGPHVSSTGRCQEAPECLLRLGFVWRKFSCKPRQSFKKRIFVATFKDNVSAIVQPWVVNSVQYRKTQIITNTMKEKAY